MARRAPAIDRAVAVLNHLAGDPTRAYSLSELCRELDLNKATAHSLLNTLADVGYLVRDEDDKTYTLGPALIAIGNAATASFPVARLAQRQMDELARQFDLEVIGSTAIGDEIVILGRAGTPRPLGINVQPGQRLPLVPPLGTVFVAWAGEEAIERWLDKLGPSATAADRDRYRQALEAVRGRGYSIAMAGQEQQRLVEELTAGGRAGGEYALTELEGAETYAISQIGAPVFGPHGEVAFGLFLIGFRGQIAAAEVPTYAEALVRAAQEVTGALRGAVPVG